MNALERALGREFPQIAAQGVLGESQILAERLGDHAPIASEESPG